MCLCLFLNSVSVSRLITSENSTPIGPFLDFYLTTLSIKYIVWAGNYIKDNASFSSISGSSISLFANGPRPGLLATRAFAAPPGI